MLTNALKKCRIGSQQTRSIIRALKTQSSSTTATHNDTERQSASSPSSTEAETHFGFQTVRQSEKADKVHKVFEEVAKSYDLMNDAMSFGVHRLWKDVFIERLGASRGTKLLDMAGGTGLFLLSFSYWTKNRQLIVLC